MYLPTGVLRRESTRSTVKGSTIEADQTSGVSQTGVDGDAAAPVGLGVEGPT
jgi:hypothetical protein